MFPPDRFAQNHRGLMRSDVRLKSGGQHLEGSFGVTQQPNITYCFSHGAKIPHRTIHFQFASTRSTMCLQPMRLRDQIAKWISAPQQTISRNWEVHLNDYFDFRAAAVHRHNEHMPAYCEQDTFWGCKRRDMVATARESKRWMDGQLMYLLSH